MDRFIIIGRDSCPFCVKAIEYCRAKDVEYIFLNYTEKPEMLERLKIVDEQKTSYTITEFLDKMEKWKIKA